MTHARAASVFRRVTMELYVLGALDPPPYCTVLTSIHAGGLRHTPCEDVAACMTSILLHRNARTSPYLANSYYTSILRETQPPPVMDVNFLSDNGSNSILNSQPMGNRTSRPVSSQIQHQFVFTCQDCIPQALDTGCVSDRVVIILFVHEIICTL